MMTADEAVPVIPESPIKDPVNHMDITMDETETPFEINGSEAQSAETEFGFPLVLPSVDPNRFRVNGEKVAAARQEIEEKLNADTPVSNGPSLATKFVDTGSLFESVFARLNPGKEIPREFAGLDTVVGLVLECEDLQLSLTLGSQESLQLKTGDHFSVPPGVYYSMKNESQTETATVKFLISK